jgi:hypothetical protein
MLKRGSYDWLVKEGFKNDNLVTRAEKCEECSEHAWTRLVALADGCFIY